MPSRVTRSVKPSRLKSPAAWTSALPAGNGISGRNVPSPLPGKTFVPIARSVLPSLLKSAVTMRPDPMPAGNEAPEWNPPAGLKAVTVTGKTAVRPAAAASRRCNPAASAPVTKVA